MPFYEIVYETGRMSVANYDDDAAAQAALKNHNDRAQSGESGGPLGQPAERIAAVYEYDKHPNEFNSDQTMSADVLITEITNIVNSLKDENGVVSVDRLATEVRGLTHPMNNAREGFGSFFKMKETKKLKTDFLTSA